MCTVYNDVVHSTERLYRQSSTRGTHGYIKYGPIRVLFFNRELRIADHYLSPISELYISI